MNLWKAIRTIGRRWYIALVVLVLCGAATASLVAHAQATYTSTATVILLSPSLRQAQDVKVDTPSNPFLTTGIPLTATAIASAATSDRVADLLKQVGLKDVKFDVRSFDQSPILFISAESNSAAATKAAITIVVKAVQSIASELQVEARAPENQFVTAAVLAPPPGAPIESLATKTKIAMGMAVASFLVVLCAALLFDSFAVRFSGRRYAARLFGYASARRGTRSDGREAVLLIDDEAPPGHSSEADAEADGVSHGDGVAASNGHGKVAARRQSRR